MIRKFEEIQRTPRDFGILFSTVSVSLILLARGVFFSFFLLFYLFLVSLAPSSLHIPHSHRPSSLKHDHLEGLGLTVLYSHEILFCNQI